jgi:UDP-glucose 4-epimerase
MNILVTGGAGYIGSHMARLLLEKGHTVTVLDTLENGYRKAVPRNATFVKGSTHDQKILHRILRQNTIDAVIHFAAYKAAGESMTEPAKYFYNNTAGTLSLLQAMAENNVKLFVFSSTAATYGNPKKNPANESAPVQPENPYGESKALVERMLPWFDQAHGIKSVALRYFNVAGAWPDGSLGEDPSKVNNLIPLVLQAAAGNRPSVRLFGTDYPTPDGTAIRDYIHVMDLTQGHLDALTFLIENNRSDIFNLGTGQGISVQEVIDRTEALTGKTIPVTRTDRRPGDPAVIYADNRKAKKMLHWKPMYGLDAIISSAWAWQQSHPHGFTPTDR